MRFSLCRTFAVCLISAGGLFLQANSLVAAQNHVVSSEDLHESVRSVARTREQNIATLEKFLSSTRAEEALNSAGLDPVQIKKAVPVLSDKELDHLAASANKAQSDFAAGRLTHSQITMIIIAVAVVAIVIAVS